MPQRIIVLFPGRCAIPAAQCLVKAACIGSWFNRLLVLQRRLVLGSAAPCAGPVSEVLAPLFNRLQRRHPPVVITIDYNPFPAIQHELTLPGHAQVFFYLFARDAVDGLKVVQQFFLFPAVADEKQMLDTMASAAQGLESSQPLVAGAFVELPDLVAVQSGPAAAYLAPVAGPAVGSPANTFPSASGHKPCQACQTGARWYRLYSQPQIVHIMRYCAVLI